MPKVVDHDERRRDLAEAFWAVALRDGVEAASVRTVAAEAGCSPASLRYYFPTQDQLLDFAWTLVVDRVFARARTLDLPDSPLEASMLLLEQVLPLDEERRAEAQIWFSVSSHARTSDRLKSRIDDLHTLLRRACTDTITELKLAGSCAPDRDTDTEATRLHALLDGLAFHGVSQPEADPPERLRAVLRAHLLDLAAHTNGARHSDHLPS
ncbi:TetR/AcrR family transcriptional regulator [Actinoallomurus sp. CA-150999]|uniref:TetR/AcrR family transcriptional regulator n=1 Tax=Actinoallomurus sp. CA-150999 TaxID=3239887 RepID=UPI003D934078